METLPEVINNLPVPKAKDIVSDAQEKAALLKDIVKQAGLAKNLGRGKEYLEFEAWQTIGAFNGATVLIEWTKPLLDEGAIVGWEARAIVKDSRGEIVASAEHQCTRDEKNWKNRDDYAIRSMAQTRAMAKALRSKYAWVAVLAGYAPTPLEEMVDLDGETTPIESDTTQSQARTPAQSKKLYAMMKNEDLPIDEFSAYLMENYQTVVEVGKDGIERKVLSKAAISRIFDNWETIVPQFRVGKGG